MEVRDPTYKDDKIFWSPGPSSPLLLFVNFRTAQKIRSAIRISNDKSDYKGDLLAGNIEVVVTSHLPPDFKDGFLLVPGKAFVYLDRSPLKREKAREITKFSTTMVYSKRYKHVVLASNDPKTAPGRRITGLRG